jgi:hypothetical protein
MGPLRCHLTLPFLLLPAALGCKRVKKKKKLLEFDRTAAKRVRIPIKRKVRNCNCIKINCRVKERVVLFESTVGTKRTLLFGQEAEHWDSISISRPGASNANSLMDITCTRIVFLPVHDSIECPF